MALSDLYFVTSDVDTYYVDPSSGLPLAGGQIYFYRDIARNVPKPIYQLSGAPPYSPASYTLLPNPLTLSAVGTVQNSGGDNEVIYYYPWITNPSDPDGPLILDLYYIVVTDSGGNPVLTREAWPNITPASTPIPGTNTDNFTTNQISNPQFTNVFTNPGIPNVYTVTGATLQVFEFAPDWFFQISGTGTVTVQIIPISGSQNVATSPPYVLDIAVSEGVTTCYLTQRFYNNSGLWTSTLNQSVYLYGSFIAENQVTGTAGVQMLYVESTAGFTPIVIVPGTFTTPYMLVTGSTLLAIPPSANTGTGFSAYVDIDLSFLPASHVQISSIQLIPTPIAPVDFILPDFDSSNRNEAYQGDYYLPRAAAKQINSFLVGWDFCVNPYQFGVSGTVYPQGTATQAQAYIADQTIALSATSNVTWIQDPITKGIQFTGTGTSDAFYIMQYLSGDQVKDMLGNSLSVNIFGYQDVPTPPFANVTMQVYLYSAPSGSTIPTLPTTIGTIATTGVFTPTATGWIAIPRSGLPTPKINLNQVTLTSDINNGFNDYGFSGWQISDPTPDTTPTQFFAMVVTFAYTTTASVLTMNSISCVPGDLPCRPGIKSFDETLRQCQYYYETSYNPSVLPGTNTQVNSLVVEQFLLIVPQTGPRFFVTTNPRYIFVQFKQVKRTNANLTVYSVDGTIDVLYLIIYVGNTIVATHDVGIGNWAIVFLGNYSFALAPVNRSNTLSNEIIDFSSLPSPSAANEEAIVNFQYVADVRLGIV